ncbi:MAG: class I SAM-dependent methyltransferase [Candidatus Schekmanbacteria bacterium]|nr:class I SAM-dependent methyltransferase [Candidatus Schekmanbacteria bacterium]
MSDYMSSAEYLDYLVANCGVRGIDDKRPVEVCKRPDVDIVLQYCAWLELQPEDKVLEVGCGIGRILKELHESFRVRPYGTDKFPAAVAAARERVGEICAEIACAPVEALPFSDRSFDKILCWGVFDLTDQARALQEMARVLMPGGKLLLTGKNDTFALDDQEARIAEEASVRKGIPNHYTDFAALLAWSTTLGLRCERARYFHRRGDFMQGIGAEERPARFYEYAVLLQRLPAASPTVTALPVIGRLRSRGDDDLR